MAKDYLSTIFGENSNLSLNLAFFKLVTASDFHKM